VKNVGVIILTIWGMFQFIAMLVGGLYEHTWIMFGVAASDIGIMYLVVNYNEKLEAKLKGE